jgi:hypothetical protein
VDADFLSYQVGHTPDIDLQVSLLTDFVSHLYRVSVPVPWKFVPDLRYT